MDRHAIIFHAINNATGDKVHLEFNFSTQLKKLQLYCHYEWTPLIATSRIENGVVCVLFEAMLQHATCVIQNQPAFTNDLTYTHHSLILKGSHTILLFLWFLNDSSFLQISSLKSFQIHKKFRFQETSCCHFSSWHAFSLFYLIFNYSLVFFFFFLKA